ncbi:MAG: hypothetical protein DRJ03_00355 [Chloroflexi bacterium]|nr:MAG: hypothetical protein DRJ03_00355 [Chloroflexota bacterium]
MAKKQKNPKHKEAVRRKANAAAEMAKLGLKLDDDQSLIGFVFSHLAVSHLTYLGLDSINKLCKTFAGIDVCLFTQHIIPSCIPSLCPVFGVSDLVRWHDYPLIATSIGTTIEALASNAPIVYHYAFDPEFINKPHMESSDMRPAFCDPRVRVVVRHESHKELIEAEFGIQVCDTIIPDCDAEALAKLVLTEMKNAD